MENAATCGANAWILTLGFLKSLDRAASTEDLRATLLGFLAGNGIENSLMGTIIVRTTGHSSKLVRKVLRGLTGDVFRVRQSSLEAYLPRLEAEWTAGCRNGAELWRRLRADGFTGSLRASENGRPAAGAMNRLPKALPASCLLRG